MICAASWKTAQMHRCYEAERLKIILLSLKSLKKYQKYKILFEKESDQETLLKHQLWDHEIKLINDKKLTKQFIYLLLTEKLNALWQYLKENMQKEFIKELQSSTEYLILFVLKLNESLRLCVNYRALNNITIKNNYLLSLISELQNKLQRAQWFTKFDILEIFNRIWIKEEDEWKTVFYTRLEYYKYLIMSFNLINASVTFMNNVLRCYLNQFIIVYLNDILVYSKTKKEHVQHVKKILQTLTKVDLHIKSEKSEFHVQNVQFLRFIIMSQSLRMNLKKIEAVMTWSMSKSKIKVQFFLEFMNFYKCFIKRYFRIILSLTNLTKKTYHSCKLRKQKKLSRSWRNCLSLSQYWSCLNQKNLLRLRWTRQTKLLRRVSVNQMIRNICILLLTTIVSLQLLNWTMRYMTRSH